MTAKEQIIELFRTNVKGKRPNVDGKNERHDGRKGHWLEQQFGVTANADNEADLFGYELKNETTSKTTFGDWSEKGGRYSWSGTPCPKIDSYNDFGQILTIEPNKDIVAFYSYAHDKRPDKADIVPKELQKDNLEIARWYGENSPTSKRRDKCLKAKLEDKFNDKGWFTCKTDENGEYDRICFGEPVNFDDWLNLVKEGIVFFDSGMYEGNKRPYSQWRANNKFWDSLITETYK